MKTYQQMEQFSVGGEPEVISELGSLVKGEPEAEVISEPEANVTSESEAEVTSEPEAEVTSEPEAEVTTEPEPESHTTAAESRPEPEVEGNAEAEGTHNPEPEGQESSLAEAEPNWPEAFNEWGPAWHLHVYMFASLFLSIAIVTCASMTFYLRDRRRLRQGILTFTLQCLLLTFTLLRSLSLFINPYQTVHGNDSPGLVFMWTFALPGLTASYSVLLLVFLDTTKMTLGPPMFQRLSVLLGITAAHFVVVMTSDIVCFFESSACKPMLMFCQCLFILYGLLLGVGYLYTAIVVTKKCSSEVLHDEHKKVARIVKISYAASVIAFAVAVTHIYAASSEFGIYNDVTYVDAWDWWILQTLLRLEELSSAFIIVLIAFRNPLEGTKFYSWCAKWTSTTSDSNTNSSERNVANSLVTYTMVEKF